MIDEKVKQLPVKNCGAYLRKMAIDGYILVVDRTDTKAYIAELQAISRNINQIAKRANATGTVYAQDIEDIKVGETTPEEAHKIGQELAEKILGGKYEYVLTTHVDRGHLHNHLIFNAVSFVDYKKYHSNKQSYHFIRRTSDKICAAHGLSVVEPGEDRGKSYKEYTAERQGTSYKAKLKAAVDLLIPQVKDFEELLSRLEAAGYEIKRGTLPRDDGRIRLIEDIENRIKMGQSVGQAQYRIQARKQMEEYGIIKRNVDSILNPSKGRVKEQEWWAYYQRAITRAATGAI